MNPRYRRELVRLGFTIPEEATYVVHCMWRPPKGQWPALGARPRPVWVQLNDTGDHRSAAIEACLFLIAQHRGKATALSVMADNCHPQIINDVCFDWNWYDGVVTFGAEVVEVIWS
jgi:hypothetical protein